MNYFKAACTEFAIPFPLKKRLILDFFSPLYINLWDHTDIFTVTSSSC